MTSEGGGVNEKEYFRRGGLKWEKEISKISAFNQGEKVDARKGGLMGECACVKGK